MEWIAVSSKKERWVLRKKFSKAFSYPLQISYYWFTFWIWSFKYCFQLSSSSYSTKSRRLSKGCFNKSFTNPPRNFFLYHWFRYFNKFYPTPRWQDRNRRGTNSFRSLFSSQRRKAYFLYPRYWTYIKWGRTYLRWIYLYK